MLDQDVDQRRAAARRVGRVAQRLRARGVAEHAIARLCCPLGVPGLAGKEPEVIAIAIAAQVLQLRGSARAKHPMRDATLA